MGAWKTFPLKTRLKWTDEERAKLLRVCVEAGAVGDLFQVTQKSNFNEKHLAWRGSLLGNEWSMGVRALDGHAEPAIGNSRAESYRRAMSVLCPQILLPKKPSHMHFQVTHLSHRSSSGSRR